MHLYCLTNFNVFNFDIFYFNTGAAADFLQMGRRTSKRFIDIVSPYPLCIKVRQLSVSLSVMGPVGVGKSTVSERRFKSGILSLRSTGSSSTRLTVEET